MNDTSVETNESGYYNHQTAPGQPDDDESNQNTEEGYYLSVRSSVKEKGEFVELADLSSEQKRMEHDEGF